MGDCHRLFDQQMFREHLARAPNVVAGELAESITPDFASMGAASHPYVDIIYIYIYIMYIILYYILYYIILYCIILYYIIVYYIIYKYVYTCLFHF